MGDRSHKDNRYETELNPETAFRRARDYAKVFSQYGDLENITVLTNKGIASELNPDLADFLLSSDLEINGFYAEFSHSEEYVFDYMMGDQNRPIVSILESSETDLNQLLEEGFAVD